MTKDTRCQRPVPKPLPEDVDVSQALQESHFVPFFQPLVTLRTGQLAGFEVLARWQHPLAGLIPPSAFIPAAERDGWLGELTPQILRKALAAAAAALPDPLTLAINISPVQLADISLPDQIFAFATEANFPLSRLVVEITESALIGTPQIAAAIVTELKKMGCKLALDDFGTGYSSLSQLQALPFDKLKVDRSFVSSMTENRESRKIVSAVVGLGQSLGLTTIAEGIETQEQAEMVLWLGCDLGQGYFYGQPLPAEELAACVSVQRKKLKINPGSAWKRISAANFDSSPTQRLAQLQAVYDGAPVGLAFLDRNLRYVSLNQRLADMNGAEIEDHLGSYVAEMIPGFFPYVEPYIRRALGGEVVTDVEAQLPNAGETRLVSYRPVKDEAGEVVGVSLAVSDITKRKHTEEALARSEAHYRSMVDLNPQVLWIMDPQGRNLDVRPRWDKKTGLMKSQSTEHAWLESVHPADIQPTVRAIAESRRDGSAIDVRYRASDRGEGWRWKRSRGAPRFDAAGNIVCWYGSVEDIDPPSEPWKPASLAKLPLQAEARFHDEGPFPAATEKERRDKALHELAILDTPPEAEFDDLVALASEICGTPISLISLVDTERQWFKAAVGLAASETPITSSFCTHAMTQQGLFVVEDATKDERFKHNPLVLGAPHIRFYAGMPLYAGNNVPIGTLCVIDTIPRAIAPGQAKALAILSHQVQARLDLRSQRRWQQNEFKVRRDFSMQLEASNKALKEANGKLEQLRAELEQTRLQHLADEHELQKRSELDLLKNEYVAMVSHELRSPLTCVRGAVGILSAGLVGAVNEKSARLFHISLTNLDRMMRLVDDVLNLERIASGTTSLQMRQCSMKDLIQEAIEAMTPIAQEHNVEIMLAAIPHASAPELFFDGDADKTSQVIVNLLSNAVKFSPPGGKIVVTVEASTERVILRISDEGRGIPEDQLEEVFKRFRQVEQDDARRLGGTGLGLAICRAIVEQHEGSIWVERNTGKGTSFFVSLPRSRRSLATFDNVDVHQLPMVSGLPLIAA